MAQALPTLRVGIDVGGTFTDLVAVDVTTGERIALKVASTPQAPEQGVIAAIEQLFLRYEHAPRFEYFAHSTTIATNALLGQIHLELPRVVFVTTQGFRDVIEIGRQNRSEVYNLFVTRPKPLVAREDRICVRERVDYQGNVLVPLEQSEVDRVLAVILRLPFGKLRVTTDDIPIPHDDIADRPIEAIAVGLLHSYANGEHERRLGAAIAAALPDIPVTLSCEIDPEYREYERFSTAVVNAALMPIVHGYLQRLEQALAQRGISAPLYVMQSNGGLAAADRIARMPAAMIESGPAGGVIAAAELARSTQTLQILSFDMGGTSAKAGTIAGGAIQIATEFEAAGSTHSGRAVKGSGYPVRFPFVDLAEISAGGGTIAWIDGAGGLRVGPISAGADPGPACYGQSDRATVTDANVVLGRLDQTALLGGTFPIDARRSRETIAQLAQPLGLSTEETAAGIVGIIDAQMAKVLRIVTVERGLDPREFSLIAFGGNGPLHACALAGELQIPRIFVPADPGVFSAHGLLVAPIQTSFVRAILEDATQFRDGRANALFGELEESARAVLAAHGVHASAMSLRRSFEARYRGQSFELEIDGASGEPDLSTRFHEAHRRRYGYAAETDPVEIVNARLNAAGSLQPLPQAPAGTAAVANQPAAHRDVWLDGRFVATPVRQRAALANGTVISGPALIEQYDACTFVAPGWSAHQHGATLILEHPFDRACAERVEALRVNYA